MEGKNGEVGEKCKNPFQEHHALNPDYAWEWSSPLISHGRKTNKMNKLSLNKAHAARFPCSLSSPMTRVSLVSLDLGQLGLALL